MRLPKFFKYGTEMINKEFITRLAEEALQENESLFLIDVKVSQASEIKVVIDGDEGVDLEEIIRVSRAIEHAEGMDREAEDFSLEVTTPGIDAPLCNPRQYRKNIGRTLAVVKVDGSGCEGERVDATDESVMIEWVTREPKPVGKGKVNVTHSSTIPYSEIKKAGSRHDKPH